MSTNTSEWVFPEDLIPAGYDLSEVQWQTHVDDIIQIGQQDPTTNEGYETNEGEETNKGDETSEGDEPERELDMSWAVVFVRMGQELKHVGPRRHKTDILHVSKPDTYSQVPAASSAGNTEVETIFPTEDEEEIKRWKLVPCSARLQIGNCWVRFRCKLLEASGCPEDFIVEAKSKLVIACAVYRMANDENDNRLLWINLKVWKSGSEVMMELCCKKIVGNEVTELNAVELDYVEAEEVMRFYEEPYV